MAGINVSCFVPGLSNSLALPSWQSKKLAKWCLNDGSLALLRRGTSPAPSEAMEAANHSRDWKMLRTETGRAWAPQVQSAKAELTMAQQALKSARAACSAEAVKAARAVQDAQAACAAAAETEAQAQSAETRRQAAEARAESAEARTALAVARAEAAEARAEEADRRAEETKKEAAADERVHLPQA